MGTIDTLRPWTFRVEHVPQGTTAEGLKDWFEPEDRPRITVRSIAPAVRNHDSAGDRTATITFQASSDQVRNPRLLDDNLGIDSSFYGFTPLYHPEGSIAADIIGVTGLAAHAYASWAHSDQKMWLRDYLPKDVPNARVLIYGYPSQLQGNMSRSILSDYSNSFTRRLLDMRASARCEDRPIIFIGHSLGCLIIKKALSDVQGSDHVHSSRLPVSLIIFLGAPHKGLRTTALETLVKSRPTEDMIRELKAESPTLTDLNDRFRHVAKNIDILTCYELYPTKTAIRMNDGSWKREGEPEMMVQPDSAKLFWPREKSIPCHVDHRQIAKLERGESGIYPSISWAIKSAVEEQTNLGSSRLPMSEDVATEDPSTTYNKNLELDLNVSFSHAVNTPRDEKEVFSAATASKIPDAVLSEQLCTAVKDGNVGKVHELLARGCSVHSLSVEDRFIKVAAYLNEGKDPYLLAAFLRQEKTLKLLLEHGADPSQVGPHGFTALHAAVYGEGNNYGGIGRMYPPTASVIALLLQHRPLLEQGDAMGRTALMHSVAYGRYTSTRILLEHGANVHARDKYQYTTLHCAVSGRNPAIVRLLISKGVEIDARSLAGGMKGTALHHACRDSSSPSAQIVQILLDAGADKDLLVGDFVEANTPLHLAARVGNVDVINVLLDCGASIEAQTSLGWKALHYAFHYGHPLTFGRLLDFGASVTRPRLFVDATARRFRFATAVPEKNKKDCVLLLNRALAKDMKSAYITADHAHLTALVRQAIEHGPFG